LFNYIIPKSKSHQKSGAAILLDSKEIFSDHFLHLLGKVIVILELLIKNKSKKIFNQYTDQEKIEIIDKFKNLNIRIFNELSLNIIIYYYTNKKVLLSIDVKSIPLFPNGNFVEEGDLYLLENVFIKESLYRK
jgi:hypothetical protein